MFICHIKKKKNRIIVELSSFPIEKYILAHYRPTGKRIGSRRKRQTANRETPLNARIS